ncbi:hypothetical protein FF38_03780 [Lucilia cuprina]|uniref:Uncharacterized protein n=1 Tax=Lucilia cuprina TaxID=7375 RepID=A0A0L0CJN6_LUCCU|nr:hypothetical protein FF38_03780 [Lucilia cuprina]
MDRVQGPYWAQILELYGPGGKISEVLKDRSQVQLKDKARNLKMLFVRLGFPIPAVFQYVTGDYASRRSSARKGKYLRTTDMEVRSPGHEVMDDHSPDSGNRIHQLQTERRDAHPHSAHTQRQLHPPVQPQMQPPVQPQYRCGLWRMLHDTAKQQQLLVVISVSIVIDYYINIG